MPNPLFSNAVSPNGATSPNNPLNDSNKRYRRGYNRFNLSRVFYNTERYADINVIDVVEGVEGDKLTFGNKHDIRTFTLKSPIMFDIYKKKTYFMVDNQAILPNNWKKVYKQPNKGDDVADDVNCYVPHFIDYFYRVFHDFNTKPYPASFGLDLFKIRSILLLESIFSNGSLLSSMNCHLSPLVKVRHYVDGDELSITFDQWLENVYNYIADNFTFKFEQISDKAFTSKLGSYGSLDYHYVSKTALIDMLRTYPDFEIFSHSTQHTVDSLNSFFEELSLNYDPGAYDDSDKIGLNLSRLVAYQLVCQQFYTNDSVDDIYSSELFIENSKSLISNVFEYGFWPYFNYNGTTVEYDVFSGHVIYKALSSWFDADFILDDSSVFDSCWYYLHSLFFYRKSLRYGDYFVGARTLPYAPGDITADVVGGGVSALDMTRKTLFLRFLNQVERVKNTWKDYLSGVTDGVAPPNPLEPRFLASSTSKVSGFEVENTAENQGNIVTVLKSGNSNYVYEVEVGEPCIVIGVSTYEIPRIYSNTVERFFSHADRFDMFNKFMQNIGDQPIHMFERNASFDWTLSFGYTPRHMEYKQRYPIASGGFVDNLPGYAFITDNRQSGQNDVDFNDSGTHISSIYIRSKNSEMDRFYESLTGLSLASYFHFICKYDNICDAQRMMEYNPSIL